ncbi:hypothetical protein Tco_0638280 [Tanacetum coccineum]
MSSDNQSLLLQYSRDGYVIEGELKDYEDSCEKSSVQVFYKEMLNQYHLVSRSFISTIVLKSTFKIKFKVKDFIQAIKESSCKRRSKLAFENADFEFESRVDTFRDKEIYLVRILKKWTKEKTKPDKTEHENGMSAKIRVQRCLHCEVMSRDLKLIQMCTCDHALPNGGSNGRMPRVQGKRISQFQVENEMKLIKRLEMTA